MDVLEAAVQQQQQQVDAEINVIIQWSIDDS